MAGYSKAWAECISALLERHGLSTWDAEEYVDGKVSRSYIHAWASRGKLPSYEMALQFLSHFSHEEARECLKAGGFPVPPNWYDDPVEAVAAALENVTTIPEEGVREIKEFAKSVERRYGLAHEHRDCAEEEAEPVRVDDRSKV